MFAVPRYAITYDPSAKKLDFATFPQADFWPLTSHSLYSVVPLNPIYSVLVDSMLTHYDHRAFNSDTHRNGAELAERLHSDSTG
jgi:hypothetical protein